MGPPAGAAPAGDVPTRCRPNRAGPSEARNVAAARGVDQSAQTLAGRREILPPPAPSAHRLYTPARAARRALAPEPRVMGQGVEARSGAFPLRALDSPALVASTCSRAAAGEDTGWAGAAP